jgi:hypothetical protein
MPVEQNPGDMFIQQPDQHEVSEELYCWLNPNRVCGGDCVAFDIVGATNKDRTRCILVNASKQSAVGVVNIARGMRSPAAPSGADVPPPRVGS